MLNSTTQKSEPLDSFLPGTNKNKVKGETKKVEINDGRSDPDNFFDNDTPIFLQDDDIPSPGNTGNETEDEELPDITDDGDEELDYVLDHVLELDYLCDNKEFTHTYETVEEDNEFFDTIEELFFNNPLDKPIKRKKRGRPRGSKTNKKKITPQSSKRKKGRPRGSKNKKKIKLVSNVPMKKPLSKDDVNSSNFNKNIFTSWQAETQLRNPIKLWNSKTMQLKSFKVPIYILKTHVATGANRRYTKIDVNRCRVQFQKTMQMNCIKDFAKKNEVKYDYSNTEQENLERVQCAYREKDIEKLEVGGNGHWSNAFSFAVMQAFVKFRSWPNRYKAIEKYMGNIKTSTEIKDHVGQVKRARIRHKEEEHPYVLYDKTNKNKNKKVKKSTTRRKSKQV